MEINVVSKHFHIPTIYDVYIGRGSPLGNPYSHMIGTKAEFIVATREIAIEKYKDWLVEKINKKDKRVILAIKEILQRLKEYNQVYLVCYCKQIHVDIPCHGDVIKKFIEDNYEKIKR